MLTVNYIAVIGCEHYVAKLEETQTKLQEVYEGPSMYVPITQHRYRKMTNSTTADMTFGDA